MIQSLFNKNFPLKHEYRQKISIIIFIIKQKQWQNQIHRQILQ
jgi:hypothetical protein